MSKFFGVGVNDCPHSPQFVVDGKIVRCKFYDTWFSMIRRCYSKKALLLRPTYKNCSVIDEWLLFSGFKKWMEKQDWEGKHLDKDILIKGNKVYSPETCVFVSSHVNLIFIKQHRQSSLPGGVTKGRREGTFKAQYGGSAKEKYLGTFPSVNDARQAYVKRKKQVILSLANDQEDDRVRKALIDLAFELN